MVQSYLIRIPLIFLLLFVGVTIGNGQITRGNPVNSSDDQQVTDEPKENQSETPKRSVKACNCNDDLEYDAGNSLIYNKKTQKPFTGVCVSFYDNENREREAEFINGKEHGNSLAYWENGNKKAITPYIQNIEHGWWRYWYEDGTLAWENNYDMGSKEGDWTWFSESGQVTKKESYSNNLKHGLSVVNYDNGTPRSEIGYANGLFDGKYVLYYDNGQIKMAKNYMQGKLDGESVFYTAEGQMLFQNYYSNGKKEGSGNFITTTECCGKLKCILKEKVVGIGSPFMRTANPSWSYSIRMMKYIKK